MNINRSISFEELEASGATYDLMVDHDAVERLIRDMIHEDSSITIQEAAIQAAKCTLTVVCMRLCELEKKLDSIKGK